MKKITFASIFLIGFNFAYAAGNPTKSLTEDEAKELLSQYSGLLKNGCPANKNANIQTAVTNGGASPLGGSNVTVITMDGAIVTITEKFGMQTGADTFDLSSFEIKCVPKQ